MGPSPAFGELMESNSVLLFFLRSEAACRVFRKEISVRCWKLSHQGCSRWVSVGGAPVCMSPKRKPLASFQILLQKNQALCEASKGSYLLRQCRGFCWTVCWNRISSLPAGAVNKVVQIRGTVDKGGEVQGRWLRSKCIGEKWEYA